MLAVEHGTPAGEARILSVLGSVYATKKNFDRAVSAYQRQYYLLLQEAEAHRQRTARRRSSLGAAQAVKEAARRAAEGTGEQQSTALVPTAPATPAAPGQAKGRPGLRAGSVPNPVLGEQAQWRQMCEALHGMATALLRCGLWKQVRAQGDEVCGIAC